MPQWDCRQTIILRHNRWRCDHGWDIDLDDGSSNYEIYHNLVHVSGGPERTATGLRQFSAGDEYSIVADAMFVAPLQGDYQVREGSPTLKLGFKNFPMNQFGVLKPELRAEARTPPLPGTLAAAGVVSQGWGRRPSSPPSGHWLGGLAGVGGGGGSQGALQQFDGQRQIGSLHPVDLVISSGLDVLAGLGVAEVAGHDVEQINVRRTGGHVAVTFLVHHRQGHGRSTQPEVNVLHAVALGRQPRYANVG